MTEQYIQAFLQKSPSLGPEEQDYLQQMLLDEASYEDVDALVDALVDVWGADGRQQLQDFVHHLTRKVVKESGSTPVVVLERSIANESPTVEREDEKKEPEPKRKEKTINRKEKRERRKVRKTKATASSSSEDDKLEDQSSAWEDCVDQGIQSVRITMI